jgi:prophage regulatory protein
MSIPKLMKIAAVVEATGLSRSAIYDRMLEGTFPRPVKLGVKAVRWVETEIAAYNESWIAKRDQQMGRA